MFLLNRFICQPAAGTATLVSRVAEGSDRRLSIRIAAVLFITALTAAAAQISLHLPFSPVPFTLQPMIVLLGGAALGARLGAASQLVYLAAGIAGLPVFAASGVLPQGLPRLFGPTAGFLMSYPLAAMVTGYLAERGFDRRYVPAVLAMGAGLMVIFAGGVIWLAAFPPAPLGFQRALAVGFYPFILADLLKIAAAGALLPLMWRLLALRVGRPDRP